MIFPKDNHPRDQKGQTFIEFIFIFVIIVTISFTFLRGFNRLVGTRWEIMLKLIARPNAIEVVFP